MCRAPQSDGHIPVDSKQLVASIASGNDGRYLGPEDPEWWCLWGVMVLAFILLATLGSNAC